MNFRIWIEAARLRTLPLSMAGIIAGSFAAAKEGFWDTKILVFAMITTLLLQILSNFANDLGDGKKGTDNAERLGPARAIQSGKITQKQMLKATILFAFLSLISAIILIYIGTKNMPTSVIGMYLILALLCVIAAITYTVGKKAYGYNGMGDIMVFIFFGLVSVLGSYSLYTKYFDPVLILIATGIGLLSVAVLNINNMRDFENDAKSKKNTIVVYIGQKNAKIYHTLLIVLSFFALFLFFMLKQWYWSIVSLLPFVVLFVHLSAVWKNKEPKLLDKEMKKVALSTFAIALLFLISTLFQC